MILTRTQIRRNVIAKFPAKRQAEAAAIFDKIVVGASFRYMDERILYKDGMAWTITKCLNNEIRTAIGSKSIAMSYWEFIYKVINNEIQFI